MTARTMSLCTPKILDPCYPSHSYVSTSSDIMRNDSRYIGIRDGEYTAYHN